MDINDITLEKFQEKVTHSSDPAPEDKLVISNGMFVQCIIHLKLIDGIEKLRQSIHG